MGWESSGVVRFDSLIIKRLPRDACLYMGEVTPPDPHFLFTIALQA